MVHQHLLTESSQQQKLQNINTNTKYKHKNNKGLWSETGQPLNKQNDELIKHRQ